MVREITVRRGEIWVAGLGIPSGSEQRGTRPVLIIQNDVGNRHSPVVIVASITSSKKPSIPTHVHLKHKTVGLKKDSIVLLEQLRTIDKALLLERLVVLPDGIMREVNEKLRISLAL